jgi:FkbM family methyltransferase
MVEKQSKDLNAQTASRMDPSAQQRFFPGSRPSMPLQVSTVLTGIARMSPLSLRSAKRFWRHILDPRMGSIFFKRKATFPKSEPGWKIGVIRQILEIEEGDFVDVGANIGQTLLDFYATGIVRRYIGFEPNPGSFGSLFTLVQDYKFKNCLVLPVGLSDATRVLNLYSLAHVPADPSASVIQDLRPTRKQKQTPVLCCRFDDIRQGLGVTSIGLIKIDVEGAELAVMQGMERSLRESRPCILCEILYSDQFADIRRYERNLRATMSFIKGIGYSMFRVQTDQMGKSFMGLREITELSIQVWTPENAHECDYVLIPTERVHRYENMVVKVR